MPALLECLLQRIAEAPDGEECHKTGKQTRTEA